MKIKYIEKRKAKILYKLQIFIFGTILLNE
jgi:hypothetical protein